MRRILSLALTFGLALPLAAQEAVSAEPASPVEAWLAAPDVVLDAGEIDLASFKWRARPVVVFADSPFDPAYQEQMDLLLKNIDPLVARDVVIVTDTAPEKDSAVRRELRPRGFALVLIGKDGRVALRKPFPWDVREITHAIDKWPIRQQELREGNRN